ncbi:MAG: type II toxin-antitoxin system VapC family toxin [Nitrospirota bacterium]
MLVDTDVLIWYMRGNKNAFKIIEENMNFHISVITYIELVQGMRNKIELNALRKSLRDWNASVIYITEEISAKAMFYVEQHYLSQSVELADAFIGATAVAYGMPLLTGNEKHYKPLKDVGVKRFHP